MKYKITLQGRTYEVEVERGEAMLLDEYEAAMPAPAAPAPASTAPAAAPTAPASPSAAAGTVVPAPLPGTVLDIRVREGEAVKAGQVLLLIEAMKMENEVAAPADGTVKQLAVTKGQTVATGDTLLVL